MDKTIAIATTRVADPGDDWHGPIVEITTDSNATLVINLPLSAADAAVDPIERALGVLGALAGSAGTLRSSRKEDGTASARTSHDRDELEAQLNKGLEDTFPGSDPVATVITSTLPKRASSDNG
jgi:hypothetical protein